MRKFKNVNSGKILTEKELNELHLKEYTEMWELELTPVAIDMKEDGKPLKDFIEYMKNNDSDNDFVEIEE